jgi:hypothetical protein
MLGWATSPVRQPGAATRPAQAPHLHQHAAGEHVGRQQVHVQRAPAVVVRRRHAGDELPRAGGGNGGHHVQRPAGGGVAGAARSASWGVQSASSSRLPGCRKQSLGGVRRTGLAWRPGAAAAAAWPPAGRPHRCGTSSAGRTPAPRRRPPALQQRPAQQRAAGQPCAAAVRSVGSVALAGSWGGVRPPATHPSSRGSPRGAPPPS